MRRELLKCLRSELTEYEWDTKNKYWRLQVKCTANIYSTQNHRLFWISRMNKLCQNQIELMHSLQVSRSLGRKSHRLLQGTARSLRDSPERDCLLKSEPPRHHRPIFWTYSRILAIKDHLTPYPIRLASVKNFIFYVPISLLLHALSVCLT